MFQILQDILGAQWWLIVAIAVYGLAWAVYGDIYKHAPSRERWIAYLYCNHWGRWYRRHLRSVLARVDRALPGPEEPKRFPGPAIAAAFSAPLLDLCLRFAVAYPIGFALLQWWIGGGAVTLGTVEVLPGEVHWLERSATIGGTALITGSFLVVLLHSLRAALAQRLVQRGVGVRFAEPIVALVALAGAGALGSAIAGAGATAGELAVAVAGVLAVGGARAGANAVAFAGMVTVTVAVAGAFAGTGAVAFAVAVAGAFAGAVAQAWLGRRAGRPAFFLALYALALLLGVALVSLDVPVPAEWARGVASLLTFLAILPIANALADFASIGLTRLLLARSVRDDDGWPWEWIVDALAAVLVLLALGSGVIWFGSSITLSPWVPLIDIRGLLEGIAAAPGEHIWLYAALFSTLAPTIAHLTLGSFGLVLRASRRLRLHIAADLVAAGRGDVVRGRWRGSVALPDKGRDRDAPRLCRGSGDLV